MFNAPFRNNNGSPSGAKFYIWDTFNDAFTNPVPLGLRTCSKLGQLNIADPNRYLDIVEQRLIALGYSGSGTITVSSPTTFTRTPGLTGFCKVSLRQAGSGPNIAWAISNAYSDSVIADRIQSSLLLCQYYSGAVYSLPPLVSSLNPQGGKYLIIQRSKGAYFIFNHDTILAIDNITTVNNSQNCYFLINDNQFVHKIGVVQLPEPFNSDWGLTKSYSATALADATGSMTVLGSTANTRGSEAIVTVTRTIGANEVFQLNFRYQDSNNRFWLEFDQAASRTYVKKLKAGVPSTLKTTTTAIPAGTILTIQFTLYAGTILYCTNLMSYTSLTSLGSDFITQPLVKVSHDVVDFAIFDLRLPASAVEVLERVEFEGDLIK